MKHGLTTLRGITLLTATGLFCLGAGVVQAQRAGRQAGRAATTTSGSTGSSMSCPPSGTSTSTGSTTTTGTTTTGTSTTGTTSSTTAVAAAQRSLFVNQGFTRSAAAFAGQGASAFSAQLTSANQAIVRWSGSTASAQRVYIGVLDGNGRVIAQQAVTQLPVQANLALTSSARYYGVRVMYANGTSSTFYSPIR
jgi:hypothetical protein